jgi:DNA-binding MarR family transcriptional regulator
MVVSRALMKIVAVKTTATAAFSLTWTRTALPEPRIPEDTDSEDTHYYAGDVKPRTGKDAVDAVIYAAHRIRTATDAALREHGLSLSGLKLLAALADGDLSMRELSQALHVAPRTVTDIIDGLEAHGLVNRCAHASDRRVTLIRLSEAGARELGQAGATSERIAAAAISDLDDGEQDTLWSLLERVRVPAAARQEARRR